LVFSFASQFEKKGKVSGRNPQTTKNTSAFLNIGKRIRWSLWSKQIKGEKRVFLASFNEDN
jgi:hypothetical protein